MGFRKGVIYNFREYLQPRYHEQLYKPVFKYKRITPRAYITHLKAKWVILNGLQTDKMTSNYTRGCETDEHFTTFLFCLDHEQTALLKDNIIISNTDKNQHIMVEVWSHDFFNRVVIIERHEKPAVQKTYTYAMSHFTKKLRAIKNFEVSGKGTSKKQ